MRSLFGIAASTGVGGGGALDGRAAERLQRAPSGGPLQLGVFGIGGGPLHHSNRCPLIISLDEYGDSGPYLGTVWADTDNPAL